MEFLSVRDAWKIIKDKVLRHVKIEKIIVNVRDALGSFAADDIKALIDYPKHDIALFDGYAVRAEDTTSASMSNPVMLRLTNKDVIGRYEAKIINVGETLPKGANAVLPYEYANVEGSIIEAIRSVRPYANIALKGEDVRCGTVIVRKGECIDFFKQALLLRAGIAEVPVWRRIRVGMLVIGNEVVRNMNIYLNKDDAVYDITSPLIIGALRKCCEVVDLGIVKDDENEILRMLQREDVDVFITLGGTSLGKRDVTIKVIEKYGDVLFHGITLVPGRTMAVGLINDRPIFMLSGFPVAAFAQLKVLVEPYILRIYCATIEVLPIMAELSSRVASTIGFLNIVRVKLREEHGKIIAQPLRLRGSGILSSIALANGILLISENVEGYDRGALVAVYRRDDPWGLKYVEGNIS
ncbi:MAG: hypothetical protein DRJ66_04515 [Thermoprotei archaeon]|nr:MAG: hypothetical protein DRJ66_04515 [Thermoprotei archaeon]RLF21040.1 MAG: hypothetical protein DRZ82_00185 [Thermoprotei archaeon]